jgi:competence protein ComGC
MKTTYLPQRRAGFTRTELFVIVVIVALLVLFFLPALARGKKNKQLRDCINNLKQVGLAFRMASDDANNDYPMARSTNQQGSREYITGGNVYPHFLCMSNELATPYVLACPSDTRKPARSFATLSDSNISYFVGLDANESAPQMFLTGDRNLATNGVPVAHGLVTVKSNDTLSWTKELHDGEGNVGVADGSVQSLAPAGFQGMSSGMGTNVCRLAVP